MAVQIISSKRSVLNGTGISIPGQVTYLIDGEADIAQLPVEGITVGSQAIAIQEGTTWVLLQASHGKDSEAVPAHPGNRSYSP